MNKSFDWWCQTAVEGIAYGPDRRAVYQELYDHLEDLYDAATDAGLTPEEARSEALKRMGNARELAPQLAAVHRPFWGYMLTLSRCLVYLGILLVTLQTFVFLYYNRPSQGNEKWFYENPHEELVRIREDRPGEDRRVLDINADAAAKCDGFTFEATRAVMVFHDHATDDSQDHYSFWFRVKVSGPFQWAQIKDIPNDYFWAVDSLGNIYPSYREATYSDESFVSGGLERTGLFSYTMDMWLTGFHSEDAQWIELRYDRDGRDLRLRIDLTGGDTP